MKARIILACILSFSLLLASCAQKSSGNISEETGQQFSETSSEVAKVASSEPDLDNYDDEESLEAGNDPLEGWNRFWFNFNDFFIRYILKPIHKGYAFIVPESIRSCINNFSYNILFPVRMANSLLQGEFAQAGVEFDRSFVNFLLTLGFADPASEKKPLFPYHPETENFDWTLAKWGVSDGPYFVIPFLGPSTIRGAFGRAGDTAMKPQSYLLDWRISWGSSLYLNFNSADELYKAYDAITESALEPYIAVRNGYLNLRKQQFQPVESTK